MSSKERLSRLTYAAAAAAVGSILPLRHRPQTTPMSIYGISIIAYGIDSYFINNIDSFLFIHVIDTTLVGPFVLVSDFSSILIYCGPWQGRMPVSLLTRVGLSV